MADLQAIRDYAASLQGQDRQSFIDKFNSIKNDDNKVSVLTSRIQGLNGSNSNAPSAMDYWVINPAKNAAKAYINDAKDIGQGIGAALKNPWDVVKGVGKSLFDHPVDNLINTVKNIPNTVMNKPISTALAVTPFAEGAVANVANAARTVGNATTNTGRYFSRIKNTFEPKAVQNLNVSSSARISNLARESQAASAKDILPFQQNISNLKKSQDSSNLAIQESKLVLKDNLSKFKNELQNISESKSIDFQKKLPDWFEANGEAYGNARDAGIAKMASDGKGITYGEVSNAISQAEQEIAGALIPSDAPAMSVIRQLKSKYAPKTSGEQSGILDASGKPIIQELPNNSNEFVNASELIQDLRNVKSTLSSGAKSGRSGFNQEDLAVGFLNHGIGDILKNKVPGFAKLQSDYTPVIRAMKEAHKIFKPNQGEFNTVTATNFLKKAGTGKLEAGQERLLNTLEQGSKFAPGVGKLSQEVRVIGARIKQVQDAMVNLDKQKLAVKGSTDANISANTASIEARKALLQKRLDSLQNRAQNITRLESNKNVADKIKKALFGKAIESIPGGRVISKF